MVHGNIFDTAFESGGESKWGSRKTPHKPDIIKLNVSNLGKYSKLIITDN